MVTTHRSVLGDINITVWLHKPRHDSNIVSVLKYAYKKGGLCSEMSRNTTIPYYNYFFKCFSCKYKIGIFCPTWHVLKQNLAYIAFVDLGTLKQ